MIHLSLTLFKTFPTNKQKYAERNFVKPSMHISKKNDLFQNAIS